MEGFSMRMVLIAVTFLKSLPPSRVLELALVA
jgi:hypothetical protein